MHTASLFALVSAAFAADPPPAMSVWDFAVKGGPTIIVIALVSLIALAVIVERLIVPRRGAVAPPALVATLNGLSAEPQGALDACRASTAPIAAILGAALKHRDDSLEVTHKAIGEAGKREMVRLKHRMRLLGALPQVATMLGLLGTILGMIKTFQAVAASGQSLGKTELLARGIFEAWANTAAGLLVAIPVLIAYHVLMGRIDARAVDLDRIVTDWLERKHAPRPPIPPSAPEVINRADAALVPAGA